MWDVIILIPDHCLFIYFVLNIVIVHRCSSKDNKSQSAAGAGGLGIIRGEKIGESE